MTSAPFSDERRSKMSKNEKEYAELLELRRALVGRDRAKAGYDDAKKRLDSYKFTQDSPETIKVNSHTKRMIEIFEAPTVNLERDKAAKRDPILNFFKNLFLIICAIGVLIGGAFLVKLSAVWSWNASITDMVTDIYMGEIITYDIAVGIHLFALCFVLIIAAVICGIIAISSNAVFSAGSVAFGVCAVVSLVASFKYFYSAATGFWSNVAYFFSALLCTPKFLQTLLYVFPFFLAVAGTIALVAVLLYLCTKGIATQVDTYKKPEIDLTKLKETKEYKEALEKDRLATAKAREEYKVIYDNAKKAFEAQKTALAENVNKYADLYNNYVKKIKSVKCVSDQKKTIDWVNCIIYYMNSDRAYDVVAAVKCYEDDLRYERLRERLDEIEDSYSSELRRIEKEYNNRISEIQRENERFEREMRKEAERAQKSIDYWGRRHAEEQERIERNVRYSAEDTYRILKTCERGVSTIEGLSAKIK